MSHPSDPYQAPQWQPPRYDPRQHQQHTGGQRGRVNQQPSQQQYAPVPYAQPYAQPHPQGYGQYAPVQVAPKSTAAGLLLGLLPPCGIGCMYAGRPGVGVVLALCWLVSIPLVFAAGIGILTGFAVWVTSAVLGYTMARAWNREHGIVS